MAGANAVCVGIALANESLRACDRCGRIPGGRVHVVLRPLGLDKLGEVHLVFEHQRDGVGIWPETVRGVLEATGGSVAQLASEVERGRGGSLVEMPCKDQVGIEFDPKEAPRIANVVVVPFVGLFLAPDDPPDFVGLYVVHFQAANRVLQEHFAVVAHFHHRGNDRIPVDTREAFHGTDAVSFKDHPQAEFRFSRVQTTTINRLRAGIGERLLAFITAEPLGTVAVLSESARVGLAKWAEHGEKPSIVGAVRLKWSCYCSTLANSRFVVCPSPTRQGWTGVLPCDLLYTQ